MSAAVLATVGHGSTAMWYLTRASGLVSFVALSATVALGIVSSLGVVLERWPRFASQLLHRNLSLFSIVFIGIHIVTTVVDGFVPIGILDAVVPFRSPYRPMWVGFGAVAFDLLLAVAVTSGLRRRIGVQAWRFVHWPRFWISRLRRLAQSRREFISAHRPWRADFRAHALL